MRAHISLKTARSPEKIGKGGCSHIKYVVIGQIDCSRSLGSTERYDVDFVQTEY